MKRILQKHLEISAFLLAVVFFAMLVYSIIQTPESAPLFSVLIVSQIVDVVLLYFTLRKLWRTKWKKQLTTAAQKILSKITKKLIGFLERRNIIRGKDKKILSGKTTVSFNFSTTESQSPKKVKYPKWRNLKNDRERLGYLYRSLVEFNIKHGLLIYSSDTPSEVKNKKDNEVFEDEIFDLYIENRYKKDIETETRILNDLKNALYKRT